MIPWKLIGIGGGAGLILAALAWGVGFTMTAWTGIYDRGVTAGENNKALEYAEAAEKIRADAKARIDAAEQAAEKAEADARAKMAEIENAYQARLQEALDRDPNFNAARAVPMPRSLRLEAIPVDHSDGAD